MGTCVIRVTAPADPIKTPRQANQPQPAREKQKCVSKATGKELPCKTSDGYWSTSWGCYVPLLRPQPPKSDGIWEGHDDGAIYECFDPDIVGTAISWRWPRPHRPGRRLRRIRGCWPGRPSRQCG